MGRRKKRSSKQRTTFKKDDVQFLGNFTLPGFHYLGPGGNSSNGPPTNAVDAIAKKHDEAYDHAVDDFKKSHDTMHCFEEIQKADEKFLVEMEGVKASSAVEAVGKVVGLAGIGLKAAVEHSLGHTLYPAFDKMVDPSVTNCNRFEVRAGDELN